MNGPILVLGYGATGRAVVEDLRRRGAEVAVAQRRRPTDLPDGVGFHPCDLRDPVALRAILRGFAQMVLAVGLPYDRRVWRDTWPAIMRHVLDAAAAESVRVVFLDNLYMHGPQTGPLAETTPLTRYGAKPAIRAAVTELWQEAAARGRVRFAALRAPDFYGPGVALSHIGSSGFGALAQGKPAWLLMPPDMPHDFAYVPDIARAACSLLEADDDAFGQAWNVPCAPTRTAREILAIGARALDVDLRIRSVPLWLLPALGLAVPFVREVAEMRFTFDRPYRVDASKFARRFWADPTAFETGAVAAALSFRPGPAVGHAVPERAGA